MGIMPTDSLPDLVQQPQPLRVDHSSIAPTPGAHRTLRGHCVLITSRTAPDQLVTPTLGRATGLGQGIAGGDHKGGFLWGWQGPILRGIRDPIAWPPTESAATHLSQGILNEQGVVSFRMPAVYPPLPNCPT